MVVICFLFSIKATPKAVDALSQAHNSIKECRVCKCVSGPVCSVLSFSTGCNICVFVTVCKHVQYIHCSSFLFLGVCVVWEVCKEEALFQRTYQSPAFSRGFYLILFLLFCFSGVISFLRLKVLVSGAGRINLCSTENCFCTGGWTCSLLLSFALAPLAAFTFVSPLLVRPRWNESGQSVWWKVLRFLFIWNIYLFIWVDIFIVLCSILFSCFDIVQLMHLCEYCLAFERDTAPC